MKRTVIYDEQIIRGVAEITNNWSAHKNRFIKFATPYWVKFYGEQGLRHLIDKINKSDVPLPCRLGSFDYFNDGWSRGGVLRLMKVFLQASAGDEKAKDRLIVDLDLEDYNMEIKEL